MTKNLDYRKRRLIDQIKQLNDLNTIEKLEQNLEESVEIATELSYATRPMVEHITLEEIKAEQGEKVFDKDIFFRKAKAVEVEESIEELLALLRP